jgi:4-aminobutyrate aminotransferase-like enzyme
VKRRKTAAGRISSTARTLDWLRRFESRNVTYLAPDGTWPIVWARARGSYVWDAEDNRYLDLTAAFGVAAAGHSNPAVVRAARQQMRQLLHAMGDVHPHPKKAQLARALSELTFERWTANAAAGAAVSGKTIFCNSGFEAVEAALKTARLATGRPGVIAFEGGYHGLGYGALNVTHRAYFRQPFQDQLKEFAQWIPFPLDEEGIQAVENGILARLTDGQIGAVLVEPVQARGGIRVPPPTFLPLLRRICDEHHLVLIVDEVYTGFGRTGRWFACEHTNVVPDVICLGKALTGGFPLSACVGRAGLMDAWPPSSGEAIHTSTFLGHPVGCAMALAQIAEIRRLNLCERSERLGRVLLDALNLVSLMGDTGRYNLEARGLGLMAGLEVSDPDGCPATAATLRMIQRLLQRGFIFLPEGEAANVLSWTPPLIIAERALLASLRAVVAELETLR